MNNGKIFMSKKSLSLYEPAEITEEQKKINDREWNDPKNWHGYFFPNYSSELDNRPFVPGRYIHPEKVGGSLNILFGVKTTCNRAHGRGKLWHILAWGVVIIIALLWFAFITISF